MTLFGATCPECQASIDGVDVETVLREWKAHRAEAHLHVDVADVPLDFAPWYRLPLKSLKRST